MVVLELDKALHTSCSGAHVLVPNPQNPTKVVLGAAIDAPNNGMIVAPAALGPHPIAFGPDALPLGLNKGVADFARCGCNCACADVVATNPLRGLNGLLLLNGSGCSCCCCGGCNVVRVVLVV